MKLMRTFYRLKILTDRDYHGALKAGLEARLLRRNGEWSDGAKRTADEALDKVETVSELGEVVKEAKRRIDQ